MLILEWEIEYWLFGKVKDSITSQVAMLQIVIQIKLLIIISHQTLRDSGLTFTIHIQEIKEDL